MSEPIRRAINVRCPVAHAFAVFTERLDLWWPPSHRRSPAGTLSMEGRVGGRFVERTESGEEHLLGEVMHWEPPHRLAYTWYPGAIERPTLVQIRFVEHDGHTRVEVEHAEGDAALGEQWPVRAQKFNDAWSEVLPALATAANESSTS